MEKIRFEQITKTYNGKLGCACGCNGKYTIPSHVTLEEANKAVGYNAYDESDISDRRCKIALTKINKAIDKFSARAVQGGSYREFSGNDENGNDIWYCEGPEFVSIDINNRATTVYF